MSDRGAEVFLTGATGFIGSHVLDQLVAAGHRVRALSRVGGRVQERAGVREVIGDITRAGELVTAMRGCQALVHVAGAYSFAPRDRAGMHASNVTACAGMLEAARIAGVARAVVTSSSATVGPARSGRPATEADHAQPSGHSAYHDSKIAGERAALAARLGAVLILPTAPVGAGDVRPTPTGAMIRDFLRGRIRASVAGGMNLVAVEDVARAHVAALERGAPRQRYLVGGENLSFDELWSRLAAISGRPCPRRRLPHRLALVAGWTDELRCRVSPSAAPVVPLEGVHMSRHQMFVDAGRAERELGVVATSVDAALRRAVAWYRERDTAAA